LEYIGSKALPQNDNELDELVKQFESSGIYKSLGLLLDRWEIEMRNRSLFLKPSKSHDMVQNLLKKIIEITEDVQGVVEKFKRCGNLMKQLNLFPSENDCENLFSNLEKLQLQLFFITCRFVHIGSNINEEYHNPIMHKPNKVRINSIE